MIQIRKIREFIPRGKTEYQKYDAPFQPDINAETHEKLFENFDELLSKIPEEEKYNCFFTVSHTHPDQDKRKQTYQTAIFYDIDGIDPRCENEYQEAIEEAFGVSAEDILIIFSGHGLHLLIQTSEHILQNKKDYEKLRPAYRLTCMRLNAILKERGLDGKVDDAVFTAERLVRLPGTQNRKKDKPPVKVRVLSEGFKKLSFNLTKVAMGESFDLSEDDSVKDDQLQTSFIDTETIEKECGFLKFARENQDAVSEPQWYAAISIVSHFPDGKKKCHAYSEKSQKYSKTETELKIEQSIRSSGPRTCENISSLYEGCQTCPHFGSIKSPISIKGENFIATEKTGFYLRGKNGLTPIFEDLRRFFEKKHFYRTHKTSEQVYIFDGTHYREFERSEIRQFADIHFKPTPKDHVAREFIGWITRSHLVDDSWFRDTHKLINFKNGVLDTETGKLLEHSPDYGFLYCLPFDFNPEAKSPNFDMFLQQVTLGEENLKQLILEFMGYALCDRDYWIQKALVFIGQGSNGKTTLLKIIEMLAGYGNYSTLSMNDFQNENHRSQLEGKILNICDELPISTLKNTEMFKKLMGGTVTIRRLYQNPRVITNSAKFFFSCNELPDIHDHSEGLFRRLVLIPFRAHFSQEKGNADPGVLKKISGELSGIFNRVLAAYQRLASRGHLIDSEASAQELKVFRENLHWISTWFYEFFDVQDITERVTTPFRVVYEKYTNECIQSGERPMSKRKFFYQIRNIIPDFDMRYKRKMIEGDRDYFLLGVNLKKQEVILKNAANL